MRTYETVFILKPNLTADEQTKHIDFYKENITKNGGEIVNVELWGKQQLAYTIDNHVDGIYVLIQFNADNVYVNEELEKRFKFNEDIIRYVVVMLDEKKFKLKPRKDPIRRERPAGSKPGTRKEGEDDDSGEAFEESADDEERL